MERFEAANLCPECGGRAASYKYHDHPCADVDAHGGHMHRTCPSCAYEWAEASRIPPEGPRSAPPDPGSFVDLPRLERDASDVDAAVSDPSS